MGEAALRAPSAGLVWILHYVHADRGAFAGSRQVLNRNRAALQEATSMQDEASWHFPEEDEVRIPLLIDSTLPLLHAANLRAVDVI